MASLENPYSDSYIINYNDGDTSLERREFNQVVLNGRQIRVHTIKEGETLQSIAFRYYGNSGMWARIADYNSIYNPFTELSEGMQIYIP